MLKSIVSSHSSVLHSNCFDIFEESSTGLEMALGPTSSECICSQSLLKKESGSIQPPPPPQSSSSSSSSSSTTTRRRRKKSKNSGSKQTITIGLPNFVGSSALNPQTSVPQNNTLVRRSDIQNVPRNRTNSISSNTSGSSFSSSSGGELTSGSPTSSDGIRRTTLQERSRHDSGGSIFQRRLDYSTFNLLPKHKINSYHIKMEDECSIGNDETRSFILSSFATNKMNRVPCVVCKSLLHIFDRYPLIDGTFFLSPKQYNKSCIQVKTDGKTNYMTAICMGCLEGWSKISCRFCTKAWGGSHLILGTMYSYDIFAATPCCREKLKCNNCAQLVIHPEQCFNFFSDYSQVVSCPSCGSSDAHFAKNLNFYIRRDNNPSKLYQLNLKIQQLTLQQQQFSGGVRPHRVNSA